MDLYFNVIFSLCAIVTTQGCHDEHYKTIVQLEKMIFRQGIIIKNIKSHLVNTVSSSFYFKWQRGRLID